MSYINAESVLPKEVIELIQQYVDGKPLYIPRKDDNKKSWGEKNGTRHTIKMRNKEIFNKYRQGVPIAELTDTYFLSEKSIRRVIREEKKSIT